MTNALVPATDRRRRRTRAAVLDAAEDLFARYGFRNTSVEELAETADVALSSIYSNFPGGKADVYAALACRIAEEHVDQMRAVLQDASSEDFQAAVFDEYCRFHRDNPMAFRLLGLVDIERADTDLYDPARSRIKTHLTDLVDEAVVASGADTDESRKRILMMWAGVNGLLGLRAQGFIESAEFTVLLGRLRGAVTGHAA